MNKKAERVKNRNLDIKIKDGDSYLRVLFVKGVNIIEMINGTNKKEFINDVTKLFLKQRKKGGVTVQGIARVLAESKFDDRTVILMAFFLGFLLTERHPVLRKAIKAGFAASRSVTDFCRSNFETTIDKNPQSVADLVTVMSYSAALTLKIGSSEQGLLPLLSLLKENCENCDEKDSCKIKDSISVMGVDLKTGKVKGGNPEELLGILDEVKSLIQKDLMKPKKPQVN